MDIVTRLKKFMEDNQIASSQFADTCNIPRPTISQILNGRNKKISDELISKIHLAYPSLSILWLMFGEGNMMTQTNIEISEPKEAAKFSFENGNVSEHELFGGDDLLFKSVKENDSEKFNDNFSHNPTSSIPNYNDNDKIIDAIEKTVKGKNDTFKKITNIVVFYDDSTFQTFNPTSC